MGTLANCWQVPSISVTVARRTALVPSPAASAGSTVASNPASSAAGLLRAPTRSGRGRPRAAGPSLRPPRVRSTRATWAGEARAQPWTVHGAEGTCWPARGQSTDPATCYDGLSVTWTALAGRACWLPSARTAVTLSRAGPGGIPAWWRSTGAEKPALAAVGRPRANATSARALPGSAVPRGRPAMDMRNSWMDEDWATAHPVTTSTSCASTAPSAGVSTWPATAGTGGPAWGESLDATGSRTVPILAVQGNPPCRNCRWMGIPLAGRRPRQGFVKKSDGRVKDP